MNFKKYKDQEVLKIYSDLMEELRERKVIRSSNNPIADYGEKVISDYLRLNLVRGSNKSFDAQDSRGATYQIKARRLTRHNSSRQLGVIRNLETKNFDHLLVGIFDEEFSLIELWKIPHKTIKTYARYSKHQNGHILYARGPLLKDKSVESLLNE